MVRRMKSDAAIGGVGSGSRRRGLLLFAVLLVVAQVMLFAFLRTRKDSDAPRESAAAPGTVAKPGVSAASPVPQATPLPDAPAEAARTAAAAGPENKPLDGPDNKPPASDEQAGAADAGDDAGKDDAKAARERERRERAERERERRDRERAERDRERERARLDAEREKARVEMERERAKIELERAERARLEAEREKARLEVERAKLAAQKSAAQAETAAASQRPAGSPDVLVVVVSSRAGAGSLSREEIRNIYTGKTTFWPNNTPVRAYNRPAGSQAGRKFFRSLLGMSSSAFREHWNELQLSGGGIAPATVTSAESILARVAGASGAIGYVLESELPADVSGVRLIRFK